MYRNTVIGKTGLIIQFISTDLVLLTSLKLKRTFKTLGIRKKGGNNYNEQSEAQKHTRKESERLRWSTAGSNRRPTHFPYTQRSGWTLVMLTRGGKEGERQKEGGRKWVTTVGHGCLKQPPQCLSFLYLPPSLQYHCTGSIFSPKFQSPTARG